MSIEPFNICLLMVVHTITFIYLKIAIFWSSCPDQNILHNYKSRIVLLETNFKQIIINNEHVLPKLYYIMMLTLIFTCASLQSRSTWYKLQCNVNMSIIWVGVGTVGLVGWQEWIQFSLVQTKNGHCLHYYNFSFLFSIVWKSNKCDYIPWEESKYQKAVLCQCN